MVACNHSNQTDEVNDLKESIKDLQRQNDELRNRLDGHSERFDDVIKTLLGL